MVQVDLTASTGLHSLDEFRNLVVKQSGGAIVRLKDVANVTLGADDYEYRGRLRRPARRLYRHPGRARGQPAGRDRSACARCFPTSSRSCRSGLTGQIVYDSTDFVSSSIHEVVRDAGRGAADRRRSSCSPSWARRARC